MKRRIILVVLSMLTLFSVVAFADETADRRKATVELLEIINARAMRDQILKSVEAMMGQAFDERLKDAPPEARDALKTVKKECLAWVSESMSWEGMRDLFVDVYAQVYTEAEIRELIGFYQSPLGQKTLKKAPELIQATMQKSQEMIRKKMPDIQARMEKAIEDFKAKYTTGRSSSPDSSSNAAGPRMPPTRDGKWNAMVGMWFGSLTEKDGGKYMWISEKKGDGTSRVRFRTIDPSGKKEDSVEACEWGVSGDIYFSICKSRLEDGRPSPLAPAPDDREGYRILGLSGDVFEYEQLDTGTRYVARRVTSGFTFPE